MGKRVAHVYSANATGAAARAPHPVHGGGMSSGRVIVVEVSVPGTVPYFDTPYSRRCHRISRGHDNAPHVKKPCRASTRTTAAAPTAAPTATPTATAAAAAAANITEGCVPVLDEGRQFGEEFKLCPAVRVLENPPELECREKTRERERE